MVDNIATTISPLSRRRHTTEVDVTAGIVDPTNSPIPSTFDEKGNYIPKWLSSLLIPNMPIGAKLPVNPIYRIIAIFTLYYFAQGIFNASITFEQPYMRSRGVSLSDISASRSIATIPWSSKILFALPSDVLGIRRPFILGGLLFAAGGLAAVGAVDPGQSVPFFIGMVFLRNFGLAWSDVACDAMSVDCGLDWMAGTIQAFMSAGRNAGKFLGLAVASVILKVPPTQQAACLCTPWGILNSSTSTTSLFLPAPEANCSHLLSSTSSSSCSINTETTTQDHSLSEQVCSLIPAPIPQANYPVAFYFFSSVLIVLAPFVYLIKEERIAEAEPFEWGAFKSLKSSSTLAFLFYAFLGNCAQAVSEVPANEYTLGVLCMTAEEFSYSSLLGTVGDLVGAVFFGIVFDKLNRTLLLTVCSLGLGACLITTPFLKSITQSYIQSFFYGLVQGMVFVSNCATVMVVADKRISASFFAIAVSVMNFAALIGQAIGGPLSEKFGRMTPFYLSLSLSLMMLLTIPFFLPAFKVRDAAAAVAENLKQDNIKKAKERERARAELLGL
jgi:MFS family permease